MYERETPLVSVLLEEIDNEGYVYSNITGDKPGAVWSSSQPILDLELTALTIGWQAQSSLQMHTAVV